MKLPRWAGISPSDKHNTLSPVSSLPGDVRGGGDFAGFLLFPALETAGMFCLVENFPCTPPAVSGWWWSTSPSSWVAVGQTLCVSLVTSVTGKRVNLWISGCKSSPGGPFLTENQSIYLRVKTSQWARKSGQGEEHLHSCSVELEGLQRIFLKLLNPLRWERSRNSQATLLCSFYGFAEILIIFPGTCAAVQWFRPGHQLKNSPVAAHSGPFVCFREDFFLVTLLSKKNYTARYSQI